MATNYDADFGLKTQTVSDGTSVTVRNLLGYLRESFNNTKDHLVVLVHSLAEYEMSKKGRLTENQLH